MGRPFLSFTLMVDCRCSQQIASKSAFRLIVAIAGGDTTSFWLFVPVELFGDLSRCPNQSVGDLAGAVHQLCSSV